ncbi:hypothetical protein Glove_122g26 [Diversispora epigaea]|uniref:Uncharacterized protein n=1 Tax=Diversispora epigaea TaxID=1348612 RepID=A0A397J955_9GLOM|nr:hypothetical protein Glove_122g26 [Diversispora epigaea]
MANTQSKIDLLEEQNSKLVTEIDELRKKYAKVEGENVKLRRVIEESIELKTKFEELEKKNKMDTAKLTAENTELKIESRNWNRSRLKTLLINRKHLLQKIFRNLSIHIEDARTKVPLLHKIASEETILPDPSPEIEHSPTKSESLTELEESEIRCSASPSATSLPQDDTSKQMSKNASDISDAASNSGVCQKSKTRKSLEDEEIDEFLDSKCKERVSKEIIQAIKEKKLRDQDLSSINQDQTRKDTYISNQKSPPIIQVRKAEFHSSEVKIPYNQKIEQGIIQEVILFIQKEKILTSLTNTPKTQDSDIEVTRLFSDAEIAEGKTIKAKQKEIICWCTYRKSYQNTVAEIRIKTGVNEKTAKSQVYAIIKSSLSKVSEANLRKKTQRAGSVYKLFEKIIDPTTKKEVKGIGIDKVYGISYGTRSISELTDTQILNIINHIASIVTKNKENGHDQNYVTTETKKTLSETEVSTIITPSIQSLHTSSHSVTAFSNSEDAINEVVKSLPETKLCIPSASESITEKALSEKQTHDRDYFRNKILWRHSDLYKQFSNKKFDYYGVIETSLCPVCKLSHKDEKSVRDNSISYAGSTNARSALSLKDKDD